MFSAVTSWDGAIHNWETLNASREFIVEAVYNYQEDHFEENSPWAAVQSLTAETQPKLTFFTGTMNAPARYGARFMKHLEDNGLSYTFVDGGCPHDLFCFMTPERVAGVYATLND